MKKTLTFIILVIISMGFFSCLNKKNKPNEISESDYKSELQIENQENLEKPEVTKEFEDLSSEAYEYLMNQQKIMEEKYSIGKYEKWKY